MIELLQKLIPWLVGLPPIPKLFLTLTLLLFTTFVLAILWMSSPWPPNNMWPTEKTFDALRRRIERVSATDRRVVGIVLAAGRDGIYVNELAQQTALTRDEVIYRTKELASFDLIEILELTDKNYRVSENIRQLLGPIDRAVLEALLKDKAKPQNGPPPNGSHNLSATTFKVGDKARIVSPSGSNKVMIRLGSCDSTLTRTVDTGLTVTVKLIDKKQSPDCFLITDDGNVLGWIPKDKLEPVGPAQE